MLYNNPKKREINRKLLSFIPKDRLYEPKLFLESPELVTVKTIKKLKIPGKYIIPNHFEKIPDPNWLNMSFGKYVRLTGWKFIFIWYDTCGHILGNKQKKIKPIEDIKTVFDRKLLLDSGIFAVTLSKRTRNPIGPKQKEWAFTRKLIHKFATQNGYSLVFLDGEFYKQMYYQAYQVFRRNRRRL